MYTIKELQKLYPHITEMKYVKIGFGYCGKAECPKCECYRVVMGYENTLRYKDCIGGWIYICQFCITKWCYENGRACVLPK